MQLRPMTGRMALQFMHGTWDMGHRPDWDAAEIVETEPHWVKRRVLESIWIQRTPQTCNLERKEKFMKSFMLC